METIDLKKLKEIVGKSSKVVSWYAHPWEGQVRGPWHRWFICQKGDDDSPESIATVEDDVIFATASMNSLSALLLIIEKMKNCENCKHDEDAVNYCGVYHCRDKDKWELKD